MRLMNVHTLVISEFHGDQIPLYAILSHTWGDEEATLQDIKDGVATSLKGYRKITASCEQARFDGLPYVWIDTCCIDRRSSTELSEAINSMYSWYENATLCYTYLADVNDIERDGMESFKRSRYWTRGWTLQELIAPNIVIFFSSDWLRIGTRMDLREAVAEATNIPKPVLRFRNLKDYSVSQKMSVIQWAWRRQTTRIEDEAYCLLGIFGVSMPLLYGEGRKAFRRLQEEIIKEYDDDSIFAWQGGTDHGLLASCAAQFAFSQSVRKCVERLPGDDAAVEPFAITNRGVRMSLLIVEDCHTVPLFSLTRESSAQYLMPDPPHLQPNVQKRVLAILNCQSGTDANSRIAIVLNHDIPSDRYMRDGKIGPVKVSIDDVVGRATPKRVLVATGGNVSWDNVTIMNEEPGRLVIIQGLPTIGNLEHFKFERAVRLNGIGVAADLQENGTVSIRFREGKPLAAIYRMWDKHLAICIRSSDHEAGIDATMTIKKRGHRAKKGDIREQTTQHDQALLSGKFEKEIAYVSFGEKHTLSLSVREAEHASIVEVTERL